LTIVSATASQLDGGSDAEAHHPAVIPERAAPNDRVPPRELRVELRGYHAIQEVLRAASPFGDARDHLLRVVWRYGHHTFESITQSQSNAATIGPGSDGRSAQRGGRRLPESSQRPK
jgi:hypothetical protein